MTTDEKLAVITGNLRSCMDCSVTDFGIVKGSLFELAMIAREFGDPETAIETARLVIPGMDRVMLAEFCRIYCKYSGTDTDPDATEIAGRVLIPEITRLDEAVLRLRRHGLNLERHYGDSFAACAEDVEYGRYEYVLMPMSDPADGRLRSFERMRDKYGLKIHCAVNIPADNGGDYCYQLCGVGVRYSESGGNMRLSFTADTSADIVEYLRGAGVFGAKTVFCEAERAVVSRMRAVFDIEKLASWELGGLLMYLGADALLTVDGIYNEI